MFRKGIPALKQALFLTDYPLDVSPLAKHHATIPGLVDRFQIFIGGLECGNAHDLLHCKLIKKAGNRPLPVLLPGAPGDCGKTQVSTVLYGFCALARARARSRYKR